VLLLRRAVKLKRKQLERRNGEDDEVVQKQVAMLHAREGWREQTRDRRLAKPIPVTVIVGVLGAGKTTLIRRVIESVRDFSLGVVVNDFAALNVDGAMIQTSMEEVRHARGATMSKPAVVELSNGCVCCSLSHGLEEAIQSLEGPVDYILVETSGITDPAAMVSIIEQQLSRSVRLDSVVLVTDADRWTLAAVSRDTDFADVVLLNKIDLMDSISIEEAKVKLSKNADVVCCSFGNVPLERILDVERIEPQREAFGRIMQSQKDRLRQGGYRISESGGNLIQRKKEKLQMNQSHDLAFESIVFESDEPFSLASLQKVLIDQRFANRIARLKGSANFREVPSHCFEFQISGSGRISISGKRNRFGPVKMALACILRGEKGIGGEFDLALKQACRTFQCTQEPANLKFENGNIELLPCEFQGVSFLRLNGLKSFAMSEEELQRKYNVNLGAAQKTLAKSINLAQKVCFIGLPTDDGILIPSENLFKHSEFHKILEDGIQTAFNVDFQAVKHCRCD